MSDDLGLTADHHAEPAIEPEHTTARSNVDVVHTKLREPRRTLYVIAVVGVAAVDHDVACVHESCELIGSCARECGRHHDPRGPRRGELSDEVLERVGAVGALTHQLRDGLRVNVVNHHLVACTHQPAREVRAHATESHHSQLHRRHLPVHSASPGSDRARLAGYETSAGYE